MITATEALHLDRAGVTANDVDEAEAVLRDLDAYVREHMTFSGPIPLQINFMVSTASSAMGLVMQPTRISSDAVAKIVILKLTQGKWQASCNLMSTPPRFERGEPVPHHWMFQILPTADAYTEDLFVPRSRLI